MELGLNLSFAVKRWMTPDALGDMCASLGPKRFQMSLDQLDPWWDSIDRGAMASEYLRAFTERGLSIDSAFGGMAGYTFPQFLAPLPQQRSSSLTYFKRCLDTTRELGAEVYGSPLGGMDAVEARDPRLRERRYRDAVDLYRELAIYGAEVGIKEMMVEPTPVEKELLYTPQACLQFIEDLGPLPLRVSFLVDWGHALCAPWGSENAMLEWCKALGAYLGGIHLQQTDGRLDRHWAFDTEGLITADLIRQTAAASETTEMAQYLEFMPAYETPDDEVYESVRASVAYLTQCMTV